MFNDSSTYGVWLGSARASSALFSITTMLNVGGTTAWYCLTVDITPPPPPLSSSPPPPPSTERVMIDWKREEEREEKRLKWHRQIYSSMIEWIDERRTEKKKEVIHKIMISTWKRSFIAAVRYVISAFGCSLNMTGVSVGRASSTYCLNPS